MINTIRDQIPKIAMLGLAAISMNSVNVYGDNNWSEVSISTEELSEHYSKLNDYVGCEQKSFGEDGITAITYRVDGSSWNRETRVYDQVQESISVVTNFGQDEGYVLIENDQDGLIDRIEIYNSDVMYQNHRITIRPFADGGYRIFPPWAAQIPEESIQAVISSANTQYLEVIDQAECVPFFERFENPIAPPQ